MTDSMNFGPEWLRNLSSEGSTAGTSSGGTRYQLADYRYGREEMLALFEKGLRAPSSLSTFSPLYSEQLLPPLALLPQAEEERVWQSRTVPPGGIVRGRGGSLERGGRISRGRPYQPYGRGGYDGSGGWGGGNETTEWSPRKEYNARASSVDNWRRNRGADEDEGWRTSSNHNVRGSLEKWGRSTSWRDGDGSDERGPPERPNRSSWQEGMRGPPQRRPWENEDHLPEWATENPSESGGSFDATGAFHGSDDERDQRASHINKREVPLQKSVSQQNMITKTHPTTLPSSQSAISLTKPPDDIISEEKQKDFQAVGDGQQTDKNTEISKVENRNNKPVEYAKEPPKKPSNNMKATEHSSANHHHHQHPPIIDKHNESVHSITTANSNISNNHADNVNGILNIDPNNRVEEEFERMQEDLVKKLVVDEETPKKLNLENFAITGPPSNPLVPPNLGQTAVHEKWYYQDPQGDLQGPFLSSEMAEWFRAGYFTSQLLVKRLCDDSFFRLGDLVSLCNGNPFAPGVRINPLKQEMPNVPDNGDMLQYQQIVQRQIAYRQAATMRALNPTEPWSGLPAMQQRELLAQQVLAHPQITSELQFLHQQQQPATNPLMQMINQMQQANKLPGQTMGEKPPTAVPSQLDPIQALVQQMGGLQSLQNNLQSGPNAGLPTTIPNSAGLTGNLQNSGLSTNLQSGGLLNNFPNLPLNSASGLTGSGGLSAGGALPVPLGLSVSGGISSTGGMLVSGGLSSSGGLPNSGGIPVSAGIPGSGVLPNSVVLTGNDGIGTGGLTNSGLPVSLQSGLPSGLSDSSTLPPRPNPLGAVDPLSSTNENETIKNLLRQLANKQQSQQLDSLWQQNQYANSQTKSQWHQNDVPISMWDLQTPSVATSVPSSLPSEKSTISSEQLKLQEKERQKQLKEEQKKKREQDEKQAKKEAEERRKEEQRKQEAEKKAAEEKRKREEEKIRKELEKAKREAEERKQKEIEEKRRLREQKKLEEEARRKAEEQKRLDEIERAKREARERDDHLRKQIEVRQENNMKVQRAAPWSQANSTPELSLADIQKAEREKRAEQAALLQQQRAQQVIQEQHTPSEKQPILLNWAKKPPEQRKVKSLAEIQQEEQDRLAKQAAEARLAQQKEKESTIATVVIPTTPWSGQNLTWASTASQWSNAVPGGFWDETSLQKFPNKPSSVSKSNSTSAVNLNKQQPVKQNKSKTKKEEQQVMKLFSNGPATDEFTDWCTQALTKLNSTVDIPTFISFLRDIESALEVRDYCREYLGEGPTTQQFAAQFLEKRRMIKPKAAAQKDDMSSPAPAITPCTQHSADFQEVKGKGKKIKKSKMTKIDARILGFSVTAAPDRINVGDRDYVEN